MISINPVTRRRTGASERNRKYLISLEISSEVDLGNDFEKDRLHLDPSKLHDLLAFADLYVGEGATIACEATVLRILQYSFITTPVAY